MTIDKLQSMYHGDVLYFNWSEGGGAEVERDRHRWILREIPQYGGEPISEDIFYVNELSDLITLGMSWT